MPLEAGGLPEAGPAPAASGMLKNTTNKPVVSAATGLVGYKIATFLSTVLRSAE